MSNWINIDIPEESHESQSLGYSVENMDGTPFFVIFRNKKLGAYVNSCPHTGAPLEWQKNQFLDLEKNFIECSLHGALFEIDSGLCIHGPCEGDNLISLPIRKQGKGYQVDITYLKDLQNYE